MSFVRLLCVAFHPRLVHELFGPMWEKSKFSYQIRLLQIGEHICSEFQAAEAHCQHLVPTEHLAVEQLLWPI